MAAITSIRCVAVISIGMACSTITCNTRMRTSQLVNYYELQMSQATSPGLSYGNLHSLSTSLRQRDLDWSLMYSLHYGSHYKYSVCCCNFHWHGMQHNHLQYSHAHQSIGNNYCELQMSQATSPGCRMTTRTIC